MQHPRQLSDHFPVSISFKRRSPKSKSKHVPKWVTEHDYFPAELTDEYEARLSDFERNWKRFPNPAEKLSIFKLSVHAASSYIRRLCKDVVASTNEHQLSLYINFIKAIHEGNFVKARDIQSNCQELARVRVCCNTCSSQEFMIVKEKAAELMQLDVRERADELKAAKNHLPKEIYERKKQSIASMMKRMLPGGSCEIAAMVDAKGLIVTDVPSIAACLNEH